MAESLDEAFALSQSTSIILEENKRLHLQHDASEHMSGTL
jgi:hypothetical protein